MTTTAAILMIRDFQPGGATSPGQSTASEPLPPAPSAQGEEGTTIPSGPSSPGTPGTGEPNLSGLPVFPIADVLITERRICKACGSIAEAQSDRIHRMLHSCDGDPFKRVIRPRKRDEFPLDVRLHHTITVEVPHCACCWQQTHMFWQVMDVRPERPKVARFTVQQTEDKKRAMKKLDKVKITQLSPEEAARAL